MAYCGHKYCDWETFISNHSLYAQVMREPLYFRSKVRLYEKPLLVGSAETAPNTACTRLVGRFAARFQAL